MVRFLLPECIEHAEIRRLYKNVRRRTTTTTILVISIRLLISEKWSISSAFLVSLYVSPLHLLYLKNV